MDVDLTCFLAFYGIGLCCITVLQVANHATKYEARRRFQCANRELESEGQSAVSSPASIGAQES